MGEAAGKTLAISLSNASRRQTKHSQWSSVWSVALIVSEIISEREIRSYKESLKQITNSPFSQTSLSQLLRILLRLDSLIQKCSQNTLNRQTHLFSPEAPICSSHFRSRVVHAHINNTFPTVPINSTACMLHNHARAEKLLTFLPFYHHSRLPDHRLCHHALGILFLLHSHLSHENLEENAKQHNSQVFQKAADVINTSNTSEDMQLFLHTS